MYRAQMYPAEKAGLYRQLQAEMEALAYGERHPLPNLANAAALLFGALPHVNWAGFYLMMENELVLGPFQGKPACIRIALGKGVCGAAAQGGRAMVVEDVHAFPGHIACDGASNSEIVVPLFQGGRVIGVLDVDSPEKARFDGEDRRGLEGFARVLERCCDFGRRQI